MTDTAPPPGTAGYGAAADALAEQYEGVAFAEVHGEVLHLLPAAPARILDIGAGTGRDAAALRRLGHTVVAAEPTPELRAHGRRLHAEADIEWVDDALPDLAVVHGRSPRPFDAVLLTAVWMHLDAAERSRAMPRVAGLLAPEGRLVMRLRHGPVPAGRRMFEVTADETVALAGEHGLHPVYRAEHGDPHGRDAVRWSCLVLQRSAPTR